MTTRTWKVYGTDGHRQRESFNPSERYDWSQDGRTRILEVINADRTGTNDYTIIRITRDTAEECEQELEGQLSDGAFENSRYGRVEEITEEAFVTSRVILIDGRSVTVTAVRARFGDEDAVQDAVLVHDETDTFRNGDAIYFTPFSQVEDDDDLRCVFENWSGTVFNLEPDGVYRVEP